MISRRWFSVRNRLVVVTVAILVLGFLTTNFISYRVSTAALKQTILQNELPLTSSIIYAELQRDILQPIFASSLMANDTFVREWLIDGEHDVDRITRYLDTIRQKYGMFTSFLISDRTLNYYRFSGLDRRLQTDAIDDRWYFRAIAMTTPYEINVDYDRSNPNDITLFVNYKIEDDRHQPIGITGVGLRLSGMSDILARFSEGGRRTLYFIDREGNVQASSDSKTPIGGQLKTVPGFGAVAARIMAADEGYFEGNRDGDTILLTTRLLKELGWRIIVEQSESDAMGALWRSFLTNVAIGVSVIAIMVLVLIWAVSNYQDKIEELAVHDKLTGLANRQYFDAALDNALRRRQRYGQGFSIILLDIDHFKSVNDRFGHLRGDDAIRAVAQAVRGAVRDSDLVCRWGGEELVILAHDCGVSEALALAEKVRRVVCGTAISQPDDGLRLTVSAGIAEAITNDDAVSLIARADLGLYAAKDAGRNRTMVAPLLPQHLETPPPAA